MHSSTAMFILRYLARQGLFQTRDTSFMLKPFPRPIHGSDVKEAFLSVAHTANVPEDRILFSIQDPHWYVHLPDRLFERVFKAIYLDEKLLPGQYEGSSGPKVRETELPTLFIGNEKTQIRQIPYAEQRPWPFRFLMELGGMIVVRPDHPVSFVKELKQYVNNHPTYDIRVDARENPDGTISVFTYYFKEVPREMRRRHVNVEEPEIPHGADIRLL